MQPESLPTSSLILLQSWNGWGWGNPWRSSSPASLLKQVHLEMFAQVYIQVGFE